MPLEKANVSDKLPQGIVKTPEEVAAKAREITKSATEDVFKLREVNPGKSFDLILAKQTAELRSNLERFLADHPDAFTPEQAKAFIGSLTEEVTKALQEKPNAQ